MTDKIDGNYSTQLPVVMQTFKDSLIEPRAFEKNGKAQGDPRYQADFIFNADHPDLKAMKELAMKLARHKWPDKPFTELAFPFVSGEKIIEKRKAKGKEGNEELRGKVVMKAKSKYEPRLSYLTDDSPRKLVELETDAAKQLAKGKFFSGVEVLVEVNFYCYDPIGENAKGGVGVYLNHVLSTNKGKRFQGKAKSASETFKGYVGSVSAEDPTGGDSLDDIM